MQARSGSSWLQRKKMLIVEWQLAKPLAVVLQRACGLFFVSLRESNIVVMYYLYP
jgi:hypothetical protein